MRILLTGAALVLALVTVSVAGPEKVQFPDGYLEDFVRYDSVDRESNMAQIGELFANRLALDGLKDTGELPMGSVLVMELHKARMGEGDKPILGDNQRRIKDGLSVIAVMQKCEDCGEEYPDDIRNGNWEYAFFDPTTKALVDRDYSGCFACHKPLADQDFVFSIDTLKAAADAR